MIALMEYSVKINVYRCNSVYIGKEATFIYSSTQASI